VSTARGGLVVEVYLFESLDELLIYGAGFDVAEDESHRRRTVR